MSASRSFAILLLLLIGADNALAEIEQPDQFYCDGKKIDGWTRQSDGRRTTFWFAKAKTTDWSYQQDIVSIYDNDPSYAYFRDGRTRLFIGRLVLDSGKYSLLPKSARKDSLDDISQDSFPEPTELPTVAELLGNTDDNDGNDRQLRHIPPTAEYPQLQNSIWESAYTAEDGVTRIKARVEFVGDHGRYTLDDGTVGTLSGITYTRTQDGNFSIGGGWTLNSRFGVFSFTVPKSNVNSFVGNWHYPDASLGIGVWDGLRTD